MLNAISKNHQQYYSKFMVKENKKEKSINGLRVWFTKETNIIHNKKRATYAKTIMRDHK